MIDITGVDMVKFVQKVYELSQPRGMGMIQYQPGGLTAEEAKAFIQKDGTFSLDYVNGRQCKIATRLKEGKLVINDTWRDHTDAQFSQLLKHVGIDTATGTKREEHGGYCACGDCREKQGLGKLDPQKEFKQALKAHEDGTAFKITGLEKNYD